MTEVELSEEWLDDDPEWSEIDLDLIAEVIEFMLVEFEAGDYI